MKPKISYLSIHTKYLGEYFQPSGDQLYLEPNFLRLWTFIVKYGNIRKLCPITQAGIKPFNHGKCIGTSLALQEYYANNKNITGYYLSSYTEGITNYAPVFLHAWNNFVSTRHEYAVEFTRAISKDLLKSARYAGVEFDTDFVHWLRKVQEKNPSDILPYLGGHGRSCLTYRPLLDGKLADYPIYEEDQEGVIGELIEFLCPVEN